MIEGLVNDALEAAATLRVEGPSGRAEEIEVLIDTGYSGFLALPETKVEELELVFIGEGLAILADGRQTRFDVYDALILWDGGARPVEVDATGSRALVGMALLEGHRLVVEVVEGGLVEVVGLGQG